MAFGAEGAQCDDAFTGGRMMKRRAALLRFVRAHWLLILLGISCELLYGLYFVRQFPLLPYYSGPYHDMGWFTNHSHAGFWAFVVVFSVLFLLFGLAWRWVARAEQRAFQPATLWLILGFGALFALTMTFVYPVTALDMFAYIDQSLVLVQYHANPIFTPPANYPHDPLMTLSAGWAGSGAPYGPLGIVIDALPVFVAGRHLLADVLLLKLLFSAMALGEALMVYQIVRRVDSRLALAGALLIAWNPYVLFETSANGHNDIAMMFFAVLALLSLVENDLLFAVLLLVASALVKYSTGLLIPLIFLYGFTRQSTHRQRLTYVMLAATASAALVVAAYAPFWRGLDTLNSIQMQNQRYLYSLSSVLGHLIPGLSLARAALLGRIVFAPFYLYTLWLATRRLSDLLRACYLAMFAFLALANTNLLFWYAIAPTVLAAAVPRLPERLSVLLMDGAAEFAAALNIYVWVWLGVTDANFRPINNVSYLLLFVPAALVLLGWMVRSRNFARRFLLGGSAPATLPAGSTTAGLGESAQRDSRARPRR
jgi:hypothetical protein